LAPGRGVVVADPARNLQNLRRQQGLGVQQLLRLFNLRLREAQLRVQTFVERDDVAGQELPPERDEQARADASLLAQGERQAVGESRCESKGEGDLRV